MDAPVSPTAAARAEQRRPTRPTPAGRTAGTRGDAPRSAARRAAAPRDVPEVSEDHAHLSLQELRRYRDALQAEEGKVSYWRRILQARLDVVRAGRTGGGTAALGPERLRPVLSDARVTAGRTALITVLPVDDIPPLPDLGELWERAVPPDDVEGQQALEQDLAAAEQQLSSYRTALHGRLGAATDELIARYRVEPVLCLSALPQRSPAPPHRRPAALPQPRGGAGPQRAAARA